MRAVPLEELPPETYQTRNYPWENDERMQALRSSSPPAACRAAQTEYSSPRPGGFSLVPDKAASCACLFTRDADRFALKNACNRTCRLHSRLLNALRGHFHNFGLKFGLSNGLFVSEFRCSLGIQHSIRQKKEMPARAPAATNLHQALQAACKRQSFQALHLLG